MGWWEERAIERLAKDMAPEIDAMFGVEIFKAQFEVESSLNPQAISPAGAAGLGQIMPRTWLDLAGQVPGLTNIFDPVQNAKAAIFYLNQQWWLWTAPRPITDRMSLALASYNAGAGNILAAQRRADGANDWRSIQKHLGEVTGEHATETRNYVRRIWSKYHGL